MSSQHEDLLAKAAKGITAAQIELGHGYLTGKLDGHSFPQDFAKARRWFESAHERGAFTATVLLGSMYEQGKRVAVDIPKAIELYEAAAKGGAYLPCLYLARIFARDTGISESVDGAKDLCARVLANERSVVAPKEMQGESRRGYRRSWS